MNQNQNINTEKLAIFGGTKAVSSSYKERSRVIEWRDLIHILKMVRRNQNTFFTRVSM